MSAAKRSPRAMPMETIITRYKSAQQQQQQQHHTQKQQQQHKIQKRKQHSARHRIQKQQQLFEQQTTKKQQNSEQHSMHTTQHISEQHGIENQQHLPKQHQMQKEQQVKTEQHQIQKQEQQKIINQQCNEFTTKGKLKSKPANVEKPKRVKSTKDFLETANLITFDDCTDFYPEKPKRIINYKRIVLQPKHRMKIIGGTKSCNKRKLHMPQKDVKHFRHNSNSSTLNTEPKSPEPEEPPSELNIQDMVLLIEEGEGLDGEDLLEILTCPSPVWWEDPPSGYIEEPLFTRPKPAEQKSIKNQLLDEQNKEEERKKQRKFKSLSSKDIDNLDISKLDIHIENRDDNFMNKRCKLESLLGNIKNKVKKIDKEGDLNVNSSLYVKNRKTCDIISEDNNLNKNQNIEVQVSNPNSIIEKNMNNTEFNNKTSENNCEVGNNLNQNYISQSKQNNIEKSVNITVLNPKNTENFNKFHKKSNANNVLETKSSNIDKVIRISESNLKSSENCHTKNGNTISIINYKSDIIESNTNNIKKLYEENQNIERRISDSFEDDVPLDLEDHEILSLENMDIPIAPNVVINSVMSASDPVKVKDIDYPILTDVNKMNKNIYNNSGTKVFPRNSEKQKSSEQEFSQNKATSGEIDVTNHKLVKIDNSSKEIQKFSFIRVRKLESMKGFNTESSVISGEILSNANVLTHNFVTTVSSKPKIKVPGNVNTKVTEGKRNERGTEKFNKRSITSLIDPLADCNIINSYLSECNKIIGADEINTSSEDTSNKITINHEQDSNIQIKHNLIQNKAETNVRRFSTDSTVSDKNMSVEYLDMSLLEEDENKMDIESHNYESDGQSQESSGICKNINFKSDLDMTDSNMYDQINKSDNNDIIQYIRDNHKEIEHMKDRHKSDARRFDLDSMKIENVRSSSPINKNIVSPSKLYQNIDNKETEYVSLYKIINTASDSDVNIMTTNQVKIPAVNTNNEMNDTDFNEMAKTAFTENKTDNSEPITYEEEYLTEFDEVNIAVFAVNEETVKKIDAVNTNNEMNDSDFNEMAKTAFTENKTDNSEPITYEEEYLTEFDEVSISGNEENVEKIDEVKDYARNNNIECILMDTGEASLRNENMGDLLELNELKIIEGNLTTPDVSKINDAKKRKINYNYKHRKNMRKLNKLHKINEDIHDKLVKDHCKSCSMKNKSILISETDIVKYCLVCSSIYDTEDCKYCQKKLKRECLCEKSEYICDRCNIKMSDKEMIIEHLKLCNVGAV